jgi:hypothetical protein
MIDSIQQLEQFVAFYSTKRREMCMPYYSDLYIYIYEAKRHSAICG